MEISTIGGSAAQHLPHILNSNTKTAHSQQPTINAKPTKKQLSQCAILRASTANGLVATAIALVDAGVSVVPLEGKRPSINWNTYKKRLPTHAEIAQWERAGKFVSGVGIISGSVSNNLALIDLDSEDAIDKFAAAFPALLDTYSVQSGSGKGMHLYYYVDVLPDFIKANGVGELRSQNCQTAAPPSIHPDSRQPYIITNAVPVMRVDNLAEVAAWFNANDKPKVRPTNKPKNSRQSVTREIRTTVTQDGLLQAIIDRSGASDSNIRNGWYNGLECPFDTHTKHPNKFGIYADNGWGHCFVCDEKFTPEQVANAYGIEVEKSVKQRTTIYEDRVPDVLLNKPYLARSDIPNARTVAIKSPTGSNKTGAIADEALEIIERGGVVIMLGHRRELMRASTGRYHIEFYLDIEDMGDDYCLASISKGVVVNSLYKHMRGNVIKADLLVVDEASQVIAHFGGDTFKADGKDMARDAANAWQLFKAANIEAEKVYFLDAYLTDIDIATIETWRGDVTYVRNDHQNPIAGDSTIRYTNKDIVPELFLDDCEAGEDVHLFTTLNESKRVYQMALDRGLKNVMLINSETADSEEVQLFLADIDNNIQGVNLIFTPTISTGINIQKPIDKLYVRVASEPLSATDILQGIGRFRHKREVHIYIPANHKHNRPIDADVIYEQRRDTALKTGAAIRYDAVNGRMTITDEQDELERVLSYVDAYRNNSMNWLQADFERLAGMPVVVSDREPTSAHKQERADTIEILADNRRVGVLTAEPLSDSDYETLLEQKQHTEDDKHAIERYQIERLIGRPMTASDYGYLLNKSARDIAKRSVDVHGEDIVKIEQRDEFEFIRLPKHRQHHTLTILAIRKMLELISDAIATGNPITSGTLRLIVVTWKEQVILPFERLPDTDAGIIRKVLGMIGRKLVSEQQMITGVRVRVYRVECDPKFEALCCEIWQHRLSRRDMFERTGEYF